jgi:hypothetical protein
VLADACVCILMGTQIHEILFPKKFSNDIKPKIKVDISEMKGSMKDIHRKGSEVMQRYEMRSKKMKVIADHNKSIMNEE